MTENSTTYKRLFDDEYEKLGRSKLPLSKYLTFCINYLRYLMGHLDTIYKKINNLENLEDKYRKLEERISRLEFSPPPQGGTEYQKILEEERNNGVINNKIDS